MAKPVTIQPINFSLIRHHMKLKNYSITRMAKKLGVAISGFSEMLSGTRQMNDQRLQIVSDELKKPHNYFRTPIGRMVINKVEADLIDWSEAPDRTEAKETDQYLDITERMGYVDFSPDLPDESGVQNFDFWKKEAILPFRSENCILFWEYEGDEILIRGPARCGKSTLILEWLITTMFKNRGMQVLIARAFGVDLDAVRQNIVDVAKYKFSDPLPVLR